MVRCELAATRERRTARRRSGLPAFRSNELEVPWLRGAWAGSWPVMEPSWAFVHARAAGCELLHVDFDEDLSPFSIDACGFTPTRAGLIGLK